MKKPYIYSCSYTNILSSRHSEAKKIKCTICGYMASRKSLEDLTMHEIDDGTFRCSSCLIGEEQGKIVSSKNGEFEVSHKKSIYQNMDQ
jgi:hypothetical protein